MSRSVPKRSRLRFRAMECSRLHLQKRNKFAAKGKTLDANQEMLALGFCNIFGSFVKSMPVTGSFTRTAINNASGVKTPMSGLITGSLVLLACGLLTSTFAFIPKATLAAVIIVAMYYMFEVQIFVVLWRTKSKTPTVSLYTQALLGRDLFSVFLNPFVFKLQFLHSIYNQCLEKT